ncbi:MAG TPA: hypothetical protein VJZ91_09745 [Blastocatellia bacterium]|nr:hypothetical protein [Blastocatellia bacterium]
MSGKGSKAEGPIKPAVDGAVLDSGGRELKKGLWEVGVYWGTDGFVYHIAAEAKGSGIRHRIISKRPVGEYLRWVDGLFRPGEVPSESTGIHYRAARKLRELI